jgi:hypothetical protein
LGEVAVQSAAHLKTGCHGRSLAKWQQPLPGLGRSAAKERTPNHSTSLLGVAQGNEEDDHGDDPANNPKNHRSR